MRYVFSDGKKTSRTDFGLDMVSICFLFKNKYSRKTSCIPLDLFFFFAGINSSLKISLLVKTYFGAKGSEEYSKIDGFLCVR